jgi:hypothetical protein
MKTFFIRLFVAFGVVFVIQILLLAYLYIFDPLNIKPMFSAVPAMNEMEVSPEVEDISTQPNSDEEAPTAITPTTPSNISPAQAKALEAVGINPAAVPQSFTLEQQACFEGILGTSRVNEIKAGAIPSLAEFYSVRKCLE